MRNKSQFVGTMSGTLFFANTSPQQKTSTCCAHKLSDGELVLVAFKPNQEAQNMNADANAQGNEM